MFGGCTRREAAKDSGAVSNVNKPKATTKTVIGSRNWKISCTVSWLCFKQNHTRHNSSATVSLLAACSALCYSVPVWRPFPLKSHRFIWPTISVYFTCQPIWLLFSAAAISLNAFLLTLIVAVVVIVVAYCALFCSNTPFMHKFICISAFLWHIRGTTHTQANTHTHIHKCIHKYIYVPTYMHLLLAYTTVCDILWMPTNGRKYYASAHTLACTNIYTQCCCNVNVYVCVCVLAFISAWNLCLLKYVVCYVATPISTRKLLHKYTVSIY